MDGRRPTQGGSLAKIGEHSTEVLRSLGFDQAKIDGLLRDKAVG